MGKFMNINKIMRQTLLTFLFFIILFVPQAHSLEVKKIIIMPFEIYSNYDKSSIRESLYKNLSEEFKKEKSIQIIPTDDYLRNYIKIDEKKAISDGKSMGADLAIIGSLTQLGESLSIDARIIDVTQGNIFTTASAQGKSLINLGAIVEQLKKEILVRIGLIQ